VIYRILTLSFVFFAVVFWPEEYSGFALPVAFVFALFTVVVCSINFCRIFFHTFAASSTIAYLVYSVTAPIGVFAVAIQNSGVASDSQFFLFESRRFLYEGSVDALFSTWGSFIPVIFGSGALLAFCGNYIGVVFFNSVLYTFAILLSSKIFKISDRGTKFLPLLGWLPLQAFYNSMISKEPIYIFLIILSVYIVTRKYETGRISLNQWIVFFVSIIVCLLLRPIAAVVVIFICISYLFLLIKIRNLILFIITMAITLFGVITLANYLNYSFPINISLDGFVSMINFTETAAIDKGLDLNVLWLFTPPWSVILSPILAVLWMISPLPLIGNFISQIEFIFSGIFTFQILATLIRYNDAILMLLFLTVIFNNKRRFKYFIYNPVLLITFLLVLVTVMFQFLESGRHRYFPGFVLAVVVLACKYSSKTR
jgi:hypothetical protein